MSNIVFLRSNEIIRISKLLLLYLELENYIIHFQDGS